MKRNICMIGIFLLLQCFAEINFNESTSNFELKFSCENNTRYRFWDSDDLILGIIIIPLHPALILHFIILSLVFKLIILNSLKLT